ncbi:MAG: YceI family protein [Pseudomonadota bacterium]
MRIIKLWSLCVALVERMARNPGEKPGHALRSRSKFFLSIAGLLSIFASTTAEATPEEFVIDPAHTYATFEVRHLGISTQRGRFNHTSGRTTFDTDAGTGKIEIIIDARTIDTGNESMEKLLRGDDFFNVEKFPDINFRSTSVSFKDGKPDKIEGELTLLGTTKPIALAVLNYNCTRLPFLVRVTCGMDALTTIRRSEFGMTSLLSFVSDEVKLLIQAEAIRQEPPRPIPTE